jgi:hypothetical protein
MTRAGILLIGMAGLLQAQQPDWTIALHPPTQQEEQTKQNLHWLGDLSKRLSSAANTPTQDEKVRLETSGVHTVAGDGRC